jgi:hypothetical protein
VDSLHFSSSFAELVCKIHLSFLASHTHTLIHTHTHTQVRYRYEEAQQADRRPRKAPVETRIPGGGGIFARRCCGRIVPALRPTVFPGYRPLAVAQFGPVHETMRGTRGIRKSLWVERSKLSRCGVRGHDGRKRLRRKEEIVRDVLKEK